MAVLESSERVGVAIAHSQDQVAGSLCALQAGNGLIQGLIPLQHISQHEGERIPKSTFLSESIVIKIDSDLAHCQSVRVDTRNNSNPPVKTNIQPSNSKFRSTWVVDCNERVFPEGSV